MDIDDFGKAFPVRSRFVTSVSWSFVVLGGIGTIAAIILDARMLRALQGASNTVRSLTANLGNTSRFSPELGLSFAIPVAFGLVFLAFPLLTLIAAMGLLKRRNWARLTLVVLSTITVVVALLGIVRQFLVPAGYELIELLENLCVALVLSWLAFRLLREPVRSECG